MEYDRSLPHREYFYEIAQLPHGSTMEKPLSDYLVAFAKAHNLAWQQDDMYNVIIRKPAAPSYEGAPVLSIQAHMDMVCEKNKDTVHDFAKDPLRFVVTDDGILHADGTTLGADDCTGVAYMLSILADDTLKHPELECIFTTQEEIGMFGAMALKAEDVHGRRMISLDGGGENNTLLTSAGGCQLTIRKAMTPVANTKPCYALSIRGLTGGHSGGEIHREKGNANKLMVRILKEAQLAGLSFELCSLTGGLKDNAIPRECDAVIAFDGDAAALTAAVEASARDIAKELEFSDGKFSAAIVPCEKAAAAFSVKDTEDTINMMFLYPNGFLARSMAIEGLTVTSLNMGIVTTDAEGVKIVTSLRAMLGSAMENMYHQIVLISGLYGATVSRGANYPGWSYSEKSPMRDAMAAAVEELYHEPLNMTAAHGGCECGVFSAMHPGMDIITLGPVTRYIHTPDEELDLASFDRTYTLLTNVIARCK